MISAWRHPRPEQVAGRCIGRTDVPVDPRRSRRLAHRIRARARREGTARVIWTSPLRRSADVGRWLARWGWTHHIDARLAELDFGDWDGRPWEAIGAGPLDAWCADFAAHPPGGGEAVLALMQRCADFLREQPGAWIVGHAGWINAAARVVAGQGAPSEAADWPAAIPYGALWRGRNAGGAESQ